MTPADNDRLKVFVWRTKNDDPARDDDVIDITNDAGDPSEEFDILDSLELPTAHRLVACWNACRGIATEQLKGIGETKDDLFRFRRLMTAAVDRGCEIIDAREPKRQHTP